MLGSRSPSERNSIVLGIALAVIGGLLLLARVLSIDLLALGWPLIVVAVGVGLFLAGLAAGGPGGLGLAIPGGIVGVAGVVLAVQQATGLWSTWAYAWALVAPGGVGLAMVLYGILTGQREIARNGVPVLLTGLGLFLGFGLFFEGVLHLSGFSSSLAEPAIAIALVVLGVVIVLVGLVGRRDGGRGQSTDTTL
jgi:hypothetical protein